ncbi:hypothetical protein BOTBODRAFT_32958 [Botryobasidium botryosum FD-172 SS1]|uniref:Uncharacterized protein n=1 Tax=Botryobasidium botryosum (strain FD-172 SS1) TaxID=930990 RepID=A0A067MEH4_BOTB1|nr:hypothetical protein BOTBODRAFT_32958 [Botryobasidium botryosum FD-172 SS1]
MLPAPYATFVHSSHAARENRKTLNTLSPSPILIQCQPQQPPPRYSCFPSRQTGQASLCYLPCARNVANQRELWHRTRASPDAAPLRLGIFRSTPANDSAAQNQ